MKLRTLCVLGSVALLLTMGGWVRQASAAPLVPEQQTASDGTGTAVTPASSVLQVTGNSNSFTISAQHADVLSLLKLVFDQGHRQFVPDGSVTGDVTLSLSGQKLENVLVSICKQTFLRYEVDRNNIYQFRRDDESLRNLLLKTQLINNVLQDQLRRMGYAVPSGMDEASRNVGRRQSAPGTNPAFGRNFGEENSSRASGGFGGGGGSAGRSRGEGTKDSLGAPQNGGGVAPGVRGKSRDGDEPHTDTGATKGALTRKTDSSTKNGTQNDPPPPSPAGPAGPAGEAGPQGPQRSGGLSGGAGTPGAVDKTGQMDTKTFLSQVPNLENDAQWQMFLKQNNFAMINTKGEDMAVRDVLSDLSRQSHIPILIDPAVPKGAEFVLNGYITARPLNEVLNILAYKAHLEWRLVNGRIYVTTTPQLQLYLRGAVLPGPGTSVGGGITILPPNSNARRVPPAQSKPDDANKEKPQEKDKGN